MNTRWPIRWRLTVWYALLFAVTTLIFGVLLYGLLQRRLLEAFDDQLTDQAALLLAVIQTEAGDIIVSGTIDPGDDDLYVRVFDGDGQIVAGTIGTRDDTERRTRPVGAALRGRTVYSNMMVDRERFRIVTIPVRVGGNAIVGALQVGLSPEDVNDALAEVVSVLRLTAPLTLIGAIGAGYYLSGRALRPVSRITSLAASISGSKLHARLDLSLPNDEIGRLARTFDDMLARIEESFERQKRFTGDAAHELRTPLSLMRSQVDLALTRPRTAAEYQEALRELDGDLTRMTDLVSTLLMLARADAEHLAVERAPLDLAATVASIVEQYRPLASQQGIAIEETTTPTPLSADEDLLLRVLVNLVDNALRHTPSGGVITVGCKLAGDAAELWVADTGDGIAPEHQAHVFDRFYRGDAGRARAQGGAGLGLAICATIVAAHGGTIALSSTAGDGARFGMRFPLTARQLPQDRPPLALRA